MPSFFLLSIVGINGVPPTDYAVNYIKTSTNAVIEDHVLTELKLSDDAVFQLQIRIDEILAIADNGSEDLQILRGQPVSPRAFARGV
jgi:hypothetical protein